MDDNPSVTPIKVTIAMPYMKNYSPVKLQQDLDQFAMMKMLNIMLTVTSDSRNQRIISG